MITSQKKEKIRQYFAQNNILMDGAFGTYYAAIYDTKELPELANTKYPERVVRIHKEYIEAGAKLIRTNTFASNLFALDESAKVRKENLLAGYQLAKEAVKGTDVLVGADIGQITSSLQVEREHISEEYVNICKIFQEAGADIFIFETFSGLEDIRAAIELVGRDAFVMVQFCVNQFGYSHSGLSARKLVQSAEAMEEIDAVGLNCGIGPGHMQQILRKIPRTEKKLRIALPNAGYPQMVSNRIIFDHQNIDYFAQKMNDIVADGADIVGGCCGTTPEYIRRIKEEVCFAKKSVFYTPLGSEKSEKMPKDSSFFAQKQEKKLIAVELAPPLGIDDVNLMEAAHLLQKSGVDVLTFPDSPSGRTRADSILMAEKVASETGICVMPHLCCRDKNAIAMRSQLLGAYINGIYNFLVVTGDPIPGMARSSVKSVFHFDSVGLMHIINDMNEEQFADNPVCFGGAINQGRRNIEIEIKRVKKKMEAGASFFLTQPVSTAESAERLRLIKQQTGARILCGIMPFVSLKNALFMKNEMTGIEVTEEVLSRYRADMTREEGEQVGIALAKEMMALTQDFADGYYFSFPFNRVGMLEKILEK